MSATCEKCGQPLVNASAYIGGRGYVPFLICPAIAEDGGDTSAHTVREKLVADYDAEREARECAA